MVVQWLDRCPALPSQMDRCLGTYWLDRCLALPSQMDHSQALPRREEVQNPALLSR